MELPLREVQYLPPGWILPFHESRDESWEEVSLLQVTIEWRIGGWSYLLEAGVVQLVLEVVDGMEDGRVVGEEVAERLGIGFGLEGRGRGCRRLAAAALIGGAVLGRIPGGRSRSLTMAHRERRGVRVHDRSWRLTGHFVRVVSV